MPSDERAGVIYEDIDAAGLPGELFDHFFGLPFITDICEKQDAVAVFLNLFKGFLRSVVRAEIVNPDITTLSAE